MSKIQDLFRLIIANTEDAEIVDGVVYIEDEDNRLEVRLNHDSKLNKDD